MGAALDHRHRIIETEPEGGTAIARRTARPGNREFAASRQLLSRLVSAGPMTEQLRTAKRLKEYGGDERIMERERQIESYLTQSGLSDEERHTALRDLRATHTQRRYRDVSVYAGNPRIGARIQSYNRMAGDRWEPKDDEERRQFQQVKQDFELTKEEFKGAATNKAYSVLMSSAQVIFNSLGQYGITDPTPVQSAIIGVHIGGKSAESQAELWLEKATKVYGDAYNRRGAVTSRSQYAKDVDKLIGLQVTVRKAAIEELKARAEARSRSAGVIGAVTGSVDMSPAKRGKKHRPKDPAHAAAWDKLEAARQALELGWIDTERGNPALAAYRERGEELSAIDLGRKGMSGDARLQHTLAPIVQKLVNIHEAIAALKQGKLKPMSLRPVVGQVREDLLIPAGSVFDPAVKQGIEEAGETSWAMKIMDAVMFAISFTGVGGIAAGAYDLLKEYVKYTTDKRLSNTALDASKSISDEDPSLTGLILAAVDMGMNVNEVRSVFKEARGLKKVMLEGDEQAARAARKQLDELGERHGIDDLAGDVEKRSGRAMKQPVETAPPTAAADVAKPKPKPATAEPKPPRKRARLDPPPSETGAKPKRGKSSFDKGKGSRPYYHKDPNTGIPSGTTVAHAAGKVADAALENERRAFRTNMRNALTSAQGPNPTWGELQDAVTHGHVAPGAEAQRVIAKAKELNATVRDPDAIMHAADQLWEQARRTGKDPEKLLSEYYGGKLPVLNSSDAKSFWAKAAMDKPFADASFASDNHGSFVHVFQMYVIDLKHGPGTSKTFRQDLAKLTEVANVPKRQPKELRAMIWDGVFDETELGGGLNRPETLGPILDDQLNFNRARRAKKARKP